MIAAETYFELLRSLPHWGIELTVEGVTLLVGLLWGRVWVRRHDARHHAIPQGPPGPMGPGVADVSQLTQRIERLEAQRIHKGDATIPPGDARWDTSGEAGM